MSSDDIILGIPALKENPFKARPLEPGQSKLLVGREEITARWSRFLKSRNARLIVLAGEIGSGRTSLLRCLSEESGKHVHLDMFPTTDHAQKMLHEIHGSLIGFDIPSSTQELVSRLVNATDETEGALPLITLDYTNADGRALADVVSNLMSPLERLSAVVIVSLSTDQRAQWPESLIRRFDHLEVIHPLDVDEVKQLCEARIASSSRVGWTMTEEAAKRVHEESGGLPSRVMRLMRDLVDQERSNPREVKYEPDIQISVENPVDDVEDASQEKDTDEQQSADFELDLEQLSQEPPTYAGPPLASMGGFGGLARRNRDYNQVNPRFKKEENARPKVPETSEPYQGKKNELWLAEGSELVQVGEQEPEGPEFEEEYVDQFEETPYIESHDDIRSETKVEGILSQLMAALQVPEGLGLADLLAAMRRPVIGQRESNALDIHTLRNLSKGEAVIVEVSSDREVSPSDARLQDRLNIRRPRMSQMCNRLFRAGILSVQQRGRTRHFKLTNDARAQLVAWGMMEGSL